MRGGMFGGGVAWYLMLHEMQRVQRAQRRDDGPKIGFHAKL